MRTYNKNVMNMQKGANFQNIKLQNMIIIYIKSLSQETNY